MWQYLLQKRYLGTCNRPTVVGNIVIDVDLFGHFCDGESGENMADGILTKTKEMLGDMYKRKIGIKNEIFVVNSEGYIGFCTLPKWNNHVWLMIRAMSVRR